LATRSRKQARRLTFSLGEPFTRFWKSCRVTSPDSLLSKIPRIRFHTAADRFDGVKSPILRGDLYILVCPSAALSSATLFSTSPAPATSPQRKNSGAFSSLNSTSISRKLKSKQRFGSWVSFCSSNQIADLSLFAGKRRIGKEGGPPLRRSWRGDRFPPAHQQRLYRILESPQSPLAVTISFIVCISDISGGTGMLRTPVRQNGRIRV